MNTDDGPPGMGQESASMAPSSCYGNDAWATISPYSQSPYEESPMNEYPGFPAFVPHGLPSESIGRMPPPPANQSPNQLHHHHHQQHPQLMHHTSPMGQTPLPMLNTALGTTWPSQLTNPTPSSGSYSAPATTVPPLPRATPQQIETPKLPNQAEKGRKTLTTEQKRAMCQYHEENPGTRQADIGLRFGVERSTVSKVLRHKEQYLRRDQEPDPAALKRGSKAKNPDFDRTLSNYVRRQQQRGFDIKDEEIMEQARLFAHASGNQDVLLGSLTSSWLQKFKQKHGVGAARLLRRASETNIPDSARMAAGITMLDDGTSNDISPASPTRPLSPLSGNLSEEDLKQDVVNFDFSYRQQGALSSTSLASDIRDSTRASFSGGTMSPVGPFTFSPDPNTSGFASNTALPLRHDGSGLEYHHREKRSNTFPSLDVEFMNEQASTSEVMTRHLVPIAPSTMTPSSSIESSNGEAQSAAYKQNSVPNPSPTLRRIASNSSITGRSNPPISSSAASLASAETSPVSPSQEDARRAANTLLNYIQNMNSSSSALFEKRDYEAVVQLTKKLQLHQHHNSRASAKGLSRIPEGDTEMLTANGTAMMQAS